MKPDVSIIIPVHNVEPYIEACLDSVAAQTYSNFEVLLILDFCTDSSPQLCRRYAARDTRFKILDEANRPLGPATARNIAIPKARGEYICFVDSDDLLHPQAIATWIGMLRLHPQATIATAPHIIFDTPQPPRPSLRKSQIKTYNGHTAACIMLHQTGVARGLNVSPCSKLFRRSAIDPLHFPDGKLYEDLAALPPFVATLATVVTTTTPLYYYRVHSASILGHFTTRRLQVLEMIQCLRRHFRNDSQLRRAAEDRLFAAAFNMWLLLQYHTDTPHLYSRYTARLLRLLHHRTLTAPGARLRNRLGALLLLPGLTPLTTLLEHFPHLHKKLIRRH